jgi:drug/metabolite transporter (DMT)-like permease
MNGVPNAEVVAGTARTRLVHVPFALFSTWIVWGSTYLAIKIALPVLPAFLQMGSRFLAAGSMLLLIEWGRGARMPTIDQWRSASIVGTLLLVGGAGGTAFAERSVASGLAASFVAFEPALILLMGIAFKRNPARPEVIGVALGLLGVGLLISGDGFSASPVGLFAMTVATVSWSAGSVLATTTLRCAPGSAGAASQMICGGFVLLTLSSLTHEPVIWPPPPQAVGAWLYLVIFGSMLGFTAFSYLLASVRTSVAMSYTFVNPIVALALGSAFGSEHFTAHELLATAIIAAGVLILLWNRANNRIPPDQSQERGSTACSAGSSERPTGDPREK